MLPAAVASTTAPPGTGIAGWCVTPPDPDTSSAPLSARVTNTLRAPEAMRDWAADITWGGGGPQGSVCVEEISKGQRRGQQN